MQTIFALASARGRAGISVIRISGPRARDAAAALIGPVPKARTAALRNIVFNGELIDQGIVLYFQQDRSFTGEDVVELQMHGSPAVVNAVLQALSDGGLAYPAEAGEFTRQALLNNRLDLAQVEGLADLLLAETAAQRRQAHRLLGGDLRRKADLWRSRLMRACALVEAQIDFADEELPDEVMGEAVGLIEQVCLDFEQELAASAGSERIRDGHEVAIVGPPNAGKSTLMNRLARREVAITSEVAGTTRDIVEVRMDIDGLPVILLDTAGIRETADLVERLGIERARSRAEGADLRVFLMDRADSPLPVAFQDGDITLTAKSDLEGRGLPGLPGISGKTGEGVDELMKLIGSRLAGRSQGTGVLIRERHRKAVAEARGALSEALACSSLPSGGLEVVAEHLRQATRALDRLVGRIDVEDVLGEIFSTFCIGK